MVTVFFLINIFHPDTFVWNVNRGKQNYCMSSVVWIHFLKRMRAILYWYIIKFEDSSPSHVHSINNPFKGFFFSFLLQYFWSLASLFGSFFKNFYLCLHYTSVHPRCLLYPLEPHILIIVALNFCSENSSISAMSDIGVCSVSSNCVFLYFSMSCIFFFLDSWTWCTG